MFMNIKGNFKTEVPNHIHRIRQSTVEPAYNDIGLSDTTPITSDILLYRLIPHC
jgi:hypothetical protein